MVLSTKYCSSLIQQIKEEIRVNINHGPRHKVVNYQAHFPLKNLKKIQYEYFFEEELH
jgi:hypothetical protein